MFSLYMDRIDDAGEREKVAALLVKVAESEPHWGTLDELLAMMCWPGARDMLRQLRADVEEVAGWRHVGRT